MPFTSQHTIDNGIERITYTPAHRRFDTPIVFQHGMYHGAWCWQAWQELFAEWGWESHAYSLPGHAGSPVQRPIRWATLGYYYQFLKYEIERLPTMPVLMGHSMGGALTQWYLKYGKPLPAAVLVAPWTSHSMLPTVLRSIVRDPLGGLLATLTLTSTPLIRTPKLAAELFITPGSLFTPEELKNRLGPESLWILLQYNPPFWSPVKHTSTPLLWLAGAADVAVAEREEKPSAQHYGAEYVVLPETGHNLMMEKNYRETAERIHAWLLKQGIQ